MEVFFEKMHEMLEESEFDYCIEWREDDASFRIVNRQTFVHKAIPAYFHGKKLDSRLKLASLTIL